MGALVEEIAVGDAPGAWEALGFALDGDAVALGPVRVHAAGTDAGRGVVGWTLSGVEGAELDGLPTQVVDGGVGRGSPSDLRGPESGEGAAHPNGVTGVDHVVAITPQLERTVAALEAAGLDLRRVREEPTPAGAPRQAFFRLGPTILEVVQEPEEIAAKNGPDRPAFFWGMALLAPDIEATVASLGADQVSEVRAAIQPGRRIASLRRGAGLSFPLALITPPAAGRAP